MSDNISRQAAIDAIQKGLQDWDGYAFEDYRRGLYKAQDILEALQSTDRKGHWKIYDHVDRIGRVIGEKICVCDQCKETMTLPWRAKVPNFCPECGADMRGGSMRMIRDLTEMNKLEDYLKANGFEYQREDEDAEPMDKHQIIVFEDGVRSWDVVCHYGSYGSDEGLLEGMGDLFGPDVEGYLTAEVVIKKIEEVRS